MNKRAFTLIELAVVAICVGVLLLIGVPSMLTSIKRNYALDAMRNIINIYTAQHKYAQEHDGSYLFPVDQDALGLRIVQIDISYQCTILSGRNICYAEYNNGVYPNFRVKIDLDMPIVSSPTPVYCESGLPGVNTKNPCCANEALTGKNLGDQCP